MSYYGVIQWSDETAHRIAPAGASFSGGEAGEVCAPPRINDCIFSPVNRTFETVLLLQEQYITQTEIQEPPLITATPNDLLQEI